MIRRTTLILLFILCFGWINAQEADINYGSPRTYILGGVEFRGIDDKYDEETLLRQSRLRIGQYLKIPGKEIVTAINRLYDLKIFSFVEIDLDKVEDDTAWLVIHLRENPKLSTVNFIGLKKSEETKIKEQVSLLPGTQINDNIKSNLKRAIERSLKDKGYYNMDVRVLQRDDPENKGQVILDVLVEKRSKIKIQSIEITGNEGMSDAQLKRAMKKTKEKTILNFFKSSKYISKTYEEDKLNLLSRYDEKGYRDAEIISDSVVLVSPKRVNVYINVHEGVKYYFNNITWTGNKKYPSEYLSELLDIRKGDVYNGTLLKERLTMDDDAAINLYANNGYLFVDMRAEESIVGNDSINLNIRVFEGPLATINRVKIKGNTTTHEHVIRRELYTYPGQVWSKENVIRSLRELSQMGHFDPEKLVPEPLPNQAEGTVDIVYNLEEKSNDKFELSGGWGAGMIIGSVAFTFNNFSIRNIFNKDAYHPLPQGDGQTFSLQAQTNGKYYTSFSMSFMEPWFGGKKPNSFNASVYFSRQTGYGSGYGDYMVNAGVDQAKNQSMLTFGFSVGLGRRINWPDQMFQMQNSVSYQRYSLKNWNYYIIDNGNSNTLAFSTVLSRRSIYNPIFPKSGSDFSLSVTLTPPYSMFEDDERMETEKNEDKYRWIEYHKWKFHGKIYVPLTKGKVDDYTQEAKKPLVLYTGVQFGYLGQYNKHRKSPFEGFEMGGDGMTGYSLYGREYIGLRGYENGSLTNAGSSFITPASSDANVFTKITMELRYPIILGQTANTIYALAFLEAGNSWYKLKDFEPFNLYRSAGVGLRVFLPMFGMLGIDWGYGFDEISGRSDASRKGKFHFVMGQEF